MNILFEKAASIKAWLGMPEGKTFVEDAKERLSAAIKELRSASTLVELGRAQGRVDELERLVKLSDEFTKYLNRKKEER